MTKIITMIAATILLSACVAGGDTAWKNVEYQYNVPAPQPVATSGSNPLISLYR